MHHLRTLGSPALESALTHPLSSPRKQLSLLAYLGRRPHGAASRAALAALLWEDREGAKARQSLRQALLELKGALGDTLSLTDDRVAIADGALAIDATLFEQDVAAGRFADAVTRWRGEFLEGFDDVGGEGFRSWLEAERESLRRQLGTAYGRLVGAGGEAGSVEHAVGWAERWTQALPLDEGAHRRLIELLRRSGRALDALARYRAFTARLRADLDVEPSPALVRLGVELEREVERAPGRRTPGSVAIFTPDHVGRAAALAELLAAWDAACAGHVTSVVIEGENGIGKTRLGEELLRHLERQAPAVVLRARAPGAGEQLPFSAIRDLVRGLVDAPGLSGASPAALAELAALSPALAQRFQKVGPAVGDAAAIGDALAEAVMAVAEERAVVLWCDDMSQLDVSSQRVILHATRQLSGRILYLVGARNEEGSAPALAELHARPGVRRLLLQPLSPSEVDTLLGTMLEVDPTDRATLVRRLHNAADGNPLHTIELITCLIDDGALELTEQGTWHLSAGARDQLRLPATLQDAIGRRLARLGPGTRAYAAAASALGRTFDPAIVAAMADLSSTEAAAPLAELVARKLVRSASHPSTSFEFTHEVVWRVLHDSLTGEQRDALRQRTALGTAVPGAPAGRQPAAPHRRSRGRQMVLAGAAVLGAIALGLV
ncbi:MAG: BTAD domain-containing putative transcriptional regulator, partial [Gemmatimonadaceae bacterium]